ncbi:MAG: hypothetical protein K0S39_4247 [Paenibacillus sp.]|jgi:hypothetical protein|nr:hypothetical protein [Paenibacillus sp.]
MEKYKPMPMPMPTQMPAPSMPTAMPAPAPMPAPQYAAPITLHASYEEINIYEPKKHHHHGHCHKPVGWYSAGSILVLYILLVIILRSSCK